MAPTQKLTEVKQPVIKLRVSPWTYAPLAVLGVFFQVDGPARGVSTSLEASVMGVVLIAEALLLQRWFGVTLTETDAIVYGLRRRRVPWSRIQAVTHEPFLGSRRVILWTDSGRVPLRAPSTYLGLGSERFDRDYHRLGQSWLAHRGPDWQPQG